MDLKSKIRVIEDFPKKGISFKDITTLIKDREAFQETIDKLAEAIEGIDFDYFVGIEARGFIFGASLAYKLKKGFIPIRKPGKLPGNIIKEEYDLEYGTNVIEMDKDSFEKGSKVIIIDDLLATGGTCKASCDLVEKAGGQVEALLFLAELTGLEARKILEGRKVISLINWEF